MKDEQHNSGPDRPSAETELSDYQHQPGKLASENKMLRAVLDSMPDNISIKDLNGRYIFDKSGHCRIMGATNVLPRHRHGFGDLHRDIKVLPRFESR